MWGECAGALCCSRPDASSYGRGRSLACVELWASGRRARSGEHPRVGVELRVLSVTCPRHVSVEHAYAWGAVDAKSPRTRCAGASVRG